MIRKKTSLAAIPVALLLFAGCVTTAPPEQLVDARAAYRRAAAGAATEHAPTHLESARRALIRAEQSFNHAPRSEETIDLAYIAERLSQIAEAQADIALATNEKNAAEREVHVAEEQKAKATEEQLGETREELAKAEGSREADAEKDRAQLDEARKRLEREREARKEAQHEADIARAALEKVGTVQDEARGIVITIPAGVLFTSGKARLLHGSSAKLDMVVDALRDLKDRSVIVEGYTDSTGPASLNQRISEQRAQEVKDYLVKHGISSDRVEARGLGSENPVDDNSTPEGRAANRRVEIILERSVS
jgi:outer membrane protein OmpA-like peptidoglycan-associated protein